METIYDLHEKTELKAHFKKSMTEYVEAVKEEAKDEELYIIVFGTDTMTMCDTYTCLPNFNTEEGIKRCSEEDYWKNCIEVDGKDEEEVHWQIRISENEWFKHQLDAGLCNEIFRPVRDFLTDYFEEVEAGLEDPNDLEDDIVDKEIYHAASFAFEELREEGVFKNNQGKEMILKFADFEINIEADEYREIFERANKNVPMKDKYMEKIVKWTLG